MSAKSIHEADGKAILNYHLTRSAVISESPLPPPPHNAPAKLASITFHKGSSPATILDAAEQQYPWLLEQGAKFVAKPDQLIKRRGKAGLLALNKNWADARAWIQERAGSEVQVEAVKGYLRTFLIEPYCPHKSEEEYYINIHSVREVSTFPYPCFFVVPSSSGRRFSPNFLCLVRENGLFGREQSYIVFRASGNNPLSLPE